MNVVEHRLNDAGEGGGDRLRWQRDRERTDVAPVSARHLGSGGRKVGELNEFVAAQVPEEEAEPLGAFRREDKDVGGADAIERCHADFVEVRPQLTKEDFAFLER